MRVLFVCTGNTCRSPMAERLGRCKYPEHHWESAGVVPTGDMHPMTARVLTDQGCDNSGFRGRNVVDLELGKFDHLILIGETARDCCPDPPLPVQVHYWDVFDPFDVRGSQEEIRQAYDDTWTELSKRIQKLVSEMS